MKNISAKYIGLITGGLMVLVSLLMFYQFHMPDTGTVKYVCYSIYSIGIIVSLFIFMFPSTIGVFQSPLILIFTMAMSFVCYPCKIA